MNFTKMDRSLGFCLLLILWSDLPDGVMLNMLLLGSGKVVRVHFCSQTHLTLNKSSPSKINSFMKWFLELSELEEVTRLPSLSSPIHEYPAIPFIVNTDIQRIIFVVLKLILMAVEPAIQTFHNSTTLHPTSSVPSFWPL